MAKLSSLVDKAQKKQREQANAASSKVVDTNLSKLNAVENMQNRGSASAWFTKVEAPKLTPNEYDSEVSRLQQIRQQAAVDLNTDVVNDIDKRLKALREQQGLTTFGDRANDVTTAISAGVFGSAASTLGLGVNMFNDPERYQREINRLQTALDTGETTDGMVLNEAQRKTVQDSIADLQRKKKQAESKDSLHNKIYSVADRATEDSATAHLRAKQDLGKVGSTIVDAGVAFGQSAVAGVLGGVTGTGLAPFMVQAFGSAAQDARKNGGDLSDQLLLGSTQAAKEYITEKLFGIAVPQKLAGATGSFDNWIKKRIQNVAGRLEKPGAEMALGGLLTWLAGGATEALEEGIGALIEETIINPNFKGYTTDDRTTQEKFEEALYNALIGGVSGLMGVTNLLDYTPGTVSTSTGKPQIVNATRSVEQATVSPAASPGVQQVQAQAEVTKAQNPEAEVLDAATTLFTQQGMNLKTAQKRAEIVGKLVRGEEVSDKDLNRIDPTSKQTKAIFTQLTGVQFPAEATSIEALRNIYRSANAVAETARVSETQRALENANVMTAQFNRAPVSLAEQMSAEQIVERAKQARQATTPETDAQAARILAQARGEIAPDNTPLLSYKDFSARHKQVFPDASPQETARMYDLYLKENQTISFMGRRMTRQQVRNTLRSAPDGDKLTVAELDAMFDMELEAQSRDGKDATEHSVRNKEANNGRREESGQSPVQHDGQSGQPGERAGMAAAGLDQGTGSQEGAGSQADRENSGGLREGSRGPVSPDAVSADGETNFMEIHEEAWSDEMRAQTPKFKRAGITLRSALGPIPIPGTTRTCDGVSHLGVESIVQSDSPFFSFEQLCDHEVGHQYFFRDPALHQKCFRAYKQHTSKAQRNALLTVYLGSYADVYAQKSASDQAKIRNQIVEEIICDAFAGMNRSGANADQLQEFIKPIIDDWCAVRGAELESAEKRYSIDSMAEAVGLTFEKDGQMTVFKDGSGNRVGKVTEKMVQTSPLGAVIQSAVDKKFIKAADAEKQITFFTELYNLMLKTQDIDLLWAVSSSIGFQPIEAGPRDPASLNQKSKFAGYTKNSDPQYSTTVDFTTICLKTQAVIDAMSATMMELGHGLTEDEIVNIVYRNTHDAGEPVPCPVCYVFSRWVGLGGLFDNMNNLQTQYANADLEVLRADIETLSQRIDEIMVKRGYALAPRKGGSKSYVLPNSSTKKSFGDAKIVMEKELMARQLELQAKQNQDMVSGKKTMTKAEEAELAALKRDIQILDNWTWLTDVRLSENYAPVPPEILFDINAGKEFAERYPESWKFRTTRGPAMGKAATPYADEHLGQILRGAGTSDLKKAELGDPAKNPFLKSKNGKLTPAAEKALQKSIAKIKAQNLLNGQRYQSTSDFRFEYALDYLLSFVEMQALGGKVQLYTKVAEAVRMFASIGAEVNCSLMPLGIGYRVNKDGSKTLTFSSVTGMNAEDAFNLSDEFDNVQPIMVGIGNEHIRLCMADDRITFIIPYHASGAGEARYVALMDIVGEHVEEREDYSNYQTDHKIEEPTKAQKAAYDLRLKLLTGKLGILSDADKQVLRDNEILHNLYKRFYGKDMDGNISDIDPKYLNPETRNSGKLFRDNECYGAFLTSEQAKNVMPFEYWDRTSTIEQADQQGQAFVEYCESLGLRPRFSGWDGNGVYHAEFDFSKESGYWKMLIDRSVYNRDGSYHEQQAINVTNFNAGFLLREKSVKGIVQPSLVNDPAKTEKIAQKSADQVREKRGEKKYSITPAFEEWYLQGFENADERTRVQESLARLRQQYGDIPAGETPTRAVQMPRKNEQGERVHDTVQTVMEAEATPENRLGDIQKAVVDGKFADIPIENKITARRMREKIKRDGWDTALTNWTAKVRAGESSADLVAEGAILLNNAGNSDMSGEQYVDLLTDYSDLLHRTGQALQAARILKRLSPEGKLYGIQAQVRKLNDARQAKAANKKNFDPVEWAEKSEIKLDPSLVEAYRNAENDVERDLILEQIQQNIADQIPATLPEKLNTWRYLAMLGNFRTQIRNVFGNAAFQIPRAIKETVAGGIEGALSKFGVPIERTRSATADTASFKAAWSDFESVRDIILTGSKLDEKTLYANAIDSKRRIYKNAILEGYRRVVNTAMDEGDAVFCRYTYADALARFMAANGTTWDQASEVLRERGRRVAIKEAAEATYRDSNAFSSMILKARFKNPKNMLEKGVNAVIEGILPFKKTPANILVRGIEYSPLGLIRTAVDSARLAKGDENVSGSDIINDIAKTITGSGLFALGYFMVKNGLLAALGPDDEDEHDFWELQGHQSYAFEWNGKSYTIDWLAPEALPLLAGANTAEVALDEGLDMNAVVTAVTRITDPMLSMSMLQGVNDLLENITNTKTVAALPTLVANSLWSYGLQYVPTLLGQAERAADNTRRTTYVDKTSGTPTGVQYAAGKLSQKVPGWDYQQIPYIDQWGRMEQNYETELGNAFGQFLNPSYTSLIDTSKMESEIQRVFDQTGDARVLPKSAPKYFTVDGERRDLTADEYVDYATTRGQLSYQVLSDMIESAFYKNLDDAHKAEAISSALSYAGEVAKADVLETDPPKSATKVQTSDEYGISAAEYVALDAAIAGIDSLKDASGETIENSKGLLIMEAVYAAAPNLTKQQYKKLFEDLGVGKTIRGYSEKKVAKELAAMRD